MSKCARQILSVLTKSHFLLKSESELFLFLLEKIQVGFSFQKGSRAGEKLSPIGQFLGPTAAAQKIRSSSRSAIANRIMTGKLERSLVQRSLQEETIHYLGKDG